MKKVVLFLIFVISLGNIFGQDSIKEKKVLVVESTKESKSGPSKQPKFFRIGARIYIESRKDSISGFGKIKYITDSSVTVNDIKILLKDIVRINKHKLGISAIVGATTTVGGIISLALISRYYNIHTYNYDGTEGSASMGPEFTVAFIIFIGAVTTLVGIIDLAATKHYYTADHWKLTVKPESSIVKNVPPNPFSTKEKTPTETKW